MTSSSPAAREAAGEGAGQAGRAGRGERGAVRRRRPRLRTEHERGAALGGRGARREHGRDGVPRGDAARRHERQIDVGPDELQQREQPVVDAALAVHERPAMPARLRALDHERPGAGGGRLARLAGVGDRHPGLGAGGADPGEGLGQRAAEREGDDGDGVARQEVELRVERVVVETRLAQGDAGPVRVGLQERGVGADGRRIRRRAGRREEVDAERAVGERPRAGDGVPQALGGPVAAGDEAEAARAGDGRGQFRGRRTARQRGLDDRDLERVEHGAPPVAAVR